LQIAISGITGSHVRGDSTLKILPESMAAGYALPITNLGVTIQYHASFVFYRRVQLLSSNKDLSEPVVLGHIIAHELGHLMLKEGAHSNTGSAGARGSEWT
jgi:hypothetical protein